MSGERYTGRYSPGAGARAAPGTPKFRGRRAASVDVRGVLLFFLPTPLLFAAFSDIAGGAVAGAVADLAAYALFLGGAWLLREGQKAEAAFEARAVARRPAVPRKILAAAAAGLGAALATLTGWGEGPVTAGGMGALAMLSHLAAFGTDPLRHKGIDLHEAEAGRVADALERAEAKLSEIDRFARTIRDREIEHRVEALVASVRGILNQIENDPRDLSKARRYLSVYLTGAHEATRKYAENHELIADPALRSDYLALLGDLEASFRRGRQSLLETDRTDLEVEIEVLRERLGQEAGAARS